MQWIPGLPSPSPQKAWGRGYLSYLRSNICPTKQYFCLLVYMHNVWTLIWMLIWSQTTKFLLMIISQQTWPSLPPSTHTLSYSLTDSQLLRLPPLLLPVLHKLAPRWSRQDHPLSRLSALLPALRLHDAPQRRQKTTARVPLQGLPRRHCGVRGQPKPPSRHWDPDHTHFRPKDKEQ